MTPSLCHVPGCQLPVNGGGYQLCPFCMGRQQHRYERNARSTPFPADLAALQVWFCWLWLPASSDGVLLDLGGATPATLQSLDGLFFLISIFVIGMAIHLFSTVTRRPGRKDRTAAAVLAGGVMWAGTTTGKDVNDRRE